MYTLWTKESEYCPKCQIAKMALQQKGIPHQIKVIDDGTHDEEREAYSNAGVKSMPFMEDETGAIIMRGFDPEVINNLAK